MAGVEDLHPEIGSIIAQSVADTVWKKVVLEAKVKPDWAHFQAAAFEGHGVWRTVAVRSGPQLLKLIQRVREITRSLAKPGEAEWTRMTFTLKRDGEVRVDFGYDPLPAE